MVVCSEKRSKSWGRRQLVLFWRWAADMSRLSFRPRPLDFHKKLPILKSIKDFEDDDTPTSTRTQMLRLVAEADNETQVQLAFWFSIDCCLVHLDLHCSSCHKFVHKDVCCLTRSGLGSTCCHGPSYPNESHGVLVSMIMNCLSMYLFL